MALTHSANSHTPEDRAIGQALKILEDRMRITGHAITGPNNARDYMRLLLGDEDREVFAVAFLDAQHRAIACEPMFHGSLTQTIIYPREVARRALYHNAAAVILAHNHPSGEPKPSRADLAMTCDLIKVLRTFDIDVVDHFVVTGTGSASLLELGLLGFPDFPDEPRDESKQTRAEDIGPSPTSGGVLTNENNAGDKNPFFSHGIGFAGLCHNLQLGNPQACGALFTKAYAPQRLAAIVRQAENIHAAALTGVRTVGTLLAVALASGELPNSAAISAGWLVEFLGEIAEDASVFEANAAYTLEHGAFAPV